MAFFTEDLPPYGMATVAAPGIRRVVAKNPSVMTYHGTNTYLVDGPAGVIVIDPGPDSAEHVEAIIAATAGRVAKIFLTHRHHDHIGAVAALKAATHALTYAFDMDTDTFIPDCALRDGDVVEGLRAIHTPGHAADHLCFALEVDRILFTGDHVMTWASSVVSPPGGNMAAYFNSLELLMERDDRIYLPGHGPALNDPQPFVKQLFSYRQVREQEIWRSLQERPMRVTELVDRLYDKQHPRLYRAAVRNVTAHLEKLQAEGRAQMCADEAWAAFSCDTF